MNKRQGGSIPKSLMNSLLRNLTKRLILDMNTLHARDLIQGIWGQCSGSSQWPCLVLCRSSPRTTAQHRHHFQPLYGTVGMTPTGDMIEPAPVWMKPSQLFVDCNKRKWCKLRHIVQNSLNDSTTVSVQTLAFLTHVTGSA